MTLTRRSFLKAGGVAAGTAFLSALSLSSLAPSLKPGRAFAVDGGPVNGQPFFLRNIGTGLYLDISSAYQYVDGLADVYTENKTPGQQFCCYYQSFLGDRYTIEPVCSHVNNTVLAPVVAQNLASDITAQGYPADLSDYFTWKFIDSGKKTTDGNTEWLIRYGKAGVCNGADVYLDADNSTKRVQTYTLNGTNGSDNQLWAIEYVALNLIDFSALENMAKQDRSKYEELRKFLSKLKVSTSTEQSLLPQYSLHMGTNTSTNVGTEYNDASDGFDGMYFIPINNVSADKYHWHEVNFSGLPTRYHVIDVSDANEKFKINWHKVGTYKGQTVGCIAVFSDIQLIDEMNDFASTSPASKDVAEANGWNWSEHYWTLDWSRAEQGDDGAFDEYDGNGNLIGWFTHDWPKNGARLSTEQNENDDSYDCNWNKWYWGGHNGALRDQIARVFAKPSGRYDNGTKQSYHFLCIPPNFTDYFWICGVASVKIEVQFYYTQDFYDRREQFYSDVAAGKKPCRADCTNTLNFITIERGFFKSADMDQDGGGQEWSQFIYEGGTTCPGDNSSAYAKPNGYVDDTPIFAISRGICGAGSTYLDAYFGFTASEGEGSEYIAAMYLFEDQRSVTSLRGDSVGWDGFYLDFTPLELDPPIFGLQLYKNVVEGSEGSDPKSLVGAHFDLIDASTGAIATDATGAVCGSDLVTTEDGIYVDLLLAGSYYFVETQAPEGYALPDDPKTETVTFTNADAKEDKTTRTIYVVDEEESSSQPFIITVTKRIKAEDVYWPHGDPSFVFRLKDKTGKIISKAITFSENDHGTESEGYYRKSETFTLAAPVGEELILSEDDSTLRYRLAATTATNGTVNSDKTVSFIATKESPDTTYEAEFTNEKITQYGGSDAASVINSFTTP